MPTVAQHNPVSFSILLDQVNDIRHALAIGEGKLKQLPKGHKKIQDQCVLAKALSNGWKVSIGDVAFFYHPTASLQEACVALNKLGRTSRIRYKDGCYVVEMQLSRTMRNFIYRFDIGHFPNLILEG